MKTNREVGFSARIYTKPLGSRFAVRDDWWIIYFSSYLPVFCDGIPQKDGTFHFQFLMLCGQFVGSVFTRWLVSYIASSLELHLPTFIQQRKIKRQYIVGDTDSHQQVLRRFACFFPYKIDIWSRFNGQLHIDRKCGLSKRKKMYRNSGKVNCYDANMITYSQW